MEDGYSIRGEKIGFIFSGVCNFIDWYLFSISDERNVEIDFIGLKRNVNIVLYDDDGILLFEFWKGGRKNENISDILDLGDYYVDVEF